jgi:OOP family OmpA-OmpF porin
MTITPVLRSVALACLAATAACSAFAQDSAYPYVGLSLGQARAKFDQTGINTRLLGSTQQTTSLSADNSDRAWRVFGGYQVNRYFGVEAAFFDLGQFSYASSVAPPANGGVRGNFKLQGGGIDAVGTLPLGDTFALLGRAGLQYAKTRDSFTGDGGVVIANPTPSERAGNYKVGVGLQVTFSPAVQMRIEADRYRMHDGVGGQANVNVYSASLVIPFGREVRRTARAPSPVVAMAEPKAPPPVMVAPVVVAAPPAPPPVLAQLPAPRRVSFSAESLFGFDRAELQPAGMTALDGFARDAAGASFEVVVVQGHADRSGPAAYNQVLSLARADTVKAYLVSHGGFEAGRITTAGLGETQPVTKPEDCPASMTGAKLHACLQADRRVDVELSGTR